MNTDFLLTDSLAQKFYLESAKDLPIIDFHNHLNVSDLAKDRGFENIARLWVLSDPYKHRAMRILGVPERLITGNATDYEKFLAWYTSLPRLVGNPLFDWSVMELKQVFGYDLLPFQDAKIVWEELNTRLAPMCASDVLRKFNIEYQAPCAPLTEDLSLFDPAKGICPSLRGDDLCLPSKKLLHTLEASTGISIASLEDYLAAVRIRLKLFWDTGCRFTDHALDNGFSYLPDDGKNRERFTKLCTGLPLSFEEELSIRSFLLKELASAYARQGFIMQLHIGAQRSTSSRLRFLVGAAGGYAAIGSTTDVSSLVTFLDDVEKEVGFLPKTLLYTLNPTDNAVFATLSGSYAREGIEAVVTQGPAWWWCDHYQGIYTMLDTFASHSVLSTFPGMTTDSRSLLSFVRHDYFRRILCVWVSRKVQEQRLPDSYPLSSDLITRICYTNAKNMLGGTPYEL